MLLHNFLVDERTDDTAFFSSFSARQMLEDVDPSEAMRAGIVGSDFLSPIVLENDADRPIGRPLFMSMNSRDRGIQLRHKIAIIMQDNGLRRPSYPGWKRNAFGHINFTGNPE
jgi:hypothetical protein